MDLTADRHRPHSSDDARHGHRPVRRAAVVYGSTYGRTEEAAERIAALLGEGLGLPVELLDVATTEVASLDRYDLLVVGISTWNVGLLQDDWERAIPELARLDLSGATVAAFGMGDQVCYPDTFQDALGILVEGLEARGAHLIGEWPIDGYDFDASAALRDGRFLGLVLDDDNEDHLTEDRIRRWCGGLVSRLSRPRPAAALAGR